MKWLLAILLPLLFLSGTDGVFAHFVPGTSYPEPLNSNASTDSGTDTTAAIASDGAGHWVVVWLSTDTLGGTIGIDSRKKFNSFVEDLSKRSLDSLADANAASNSIFELSTLSFRFPADHCTPNRQ